MKRIASILTALVLSAGLLALPVKTEAKTGAEKHYIEVDTSNQQVRIYENLNNGTKKLVKKYICSTGKSSTPTPAGTFKMQGGRTWGFGYFVKWKCWAQYKMPFNGDILFHSILYSAPNTNAVIQSSVRDLGRAVSHGCVRLKVADAKWMFQNCPVGTVVKVSKFSSDYAKQKIGVVVEKVNLSYKKISLKKGQSFTLTAKTTPKKAANNVIWGSSKASVAKVNSKGKVTGVKIGRATITAYAAQNKAKKANCIVTVTKNNVKVTKVKLNKTELSMYPNNNVTIKATVLPEYATDKKLTYTSSDEEVAKVSKAGVITGVKPGSAVITVTADGAKAKVNITVKPFKLAGIELNKSSMDMNIGDTATLEAKLLPEHAVPTVIKWTSSNETVAGVTADGVVTATAAGTAVITATAGKFKAECVVTVTQNVQP